MSAKIILTAAALLIGCSSTSTNPGLFGGNKDAGPDALEGAAGLAGAAGASGGAAGAAGAPGGVGGAAGAPSGGAGGAAGSGGAAGTGGAPPDPCDECKCYKPAYPVSVCWGSNWWCQCPKECNPSCNLESSYSTCTIWPQGCNYWCCGAAP